MAPSPTAPATTACTSSTRSSPATSPPPRTRAAALSGLTSRPNLLVVLERGDEVAWKSVRNLQDVHVLVADQLNTYDVLCADDVVFTQGAFDAFVSAHTKGSATEENEK